MKFFSRFFAGAAILLSDIMCAVVAFNWAKMLDATTSAPASVSLIYAIPFLHRHRSMRHSGRPSFQGRPRSTTRRPAGGEHVMP